ncbi:hypothetical protein OBBRIDRAFT_799647 [Obba rivulosa]|uniref:Uncharacterized protein n=1 Tax=Obba rivulosa TaxID=1052685 RepID=A0A8E2DFF3_9APHY|nr:hypothetical protein OBBRIDRAFT_799647 [Obba rivulosa]
MRRRAPRSKDVPSSTTQKDETPMRIPPLSPIPPMIQRNRRGGGKKFTEEGREYFFDMILCELSRLPDLTRSGLCRLAKPMRIVGVPVLNHLRTLH